MRSLTFLLAVVLLPVSIHAQTSGADVKKEAAETVDASKRYLNEKKEDFEARMEARLVELRAKTKALKEAADKQGKELKEDAKTKLAALEQQEKAAAERLAAVKKAGGSAWKSLRGGVEQAVDDLDKGLNAPTTASEPKK
jgi:hypothetical protein